MNRTRFVSLAATAFAGLLIVDHGTAVAAAPKTAAEANPRIQLAHISAEVVGNGSPLVLIPGLATPRAVWADVVPELAKSHRVYLVQVNGFGGDDPGQNLSGKLLDGIVADLDGLIRTEKLRGTAVVGHSMGGLVGLILAARHPHSVGRLMVVDALPFFGVLAAPPGIEATPAALEPSARIMRDAIASTYGKPADPARTASQVAGLALKPASRARMVAWAEKADPRVTARAFYEDMITDVRPTLATIKTPITVVYPWNDSAFGEERTAAFYRRAYAAAPNVTYAPIGDAAHFVMLDQPEAFRRALNEFAAVR